MRTDPEIVKAIMRGVTIEESDIYMHIDIASRWVDANLVDKGLSDGVLMDIETYLTAHLIAIGSGRQATSEKVGSVQVQYGGKFGEGLKATTYGQMVLMLDTTGTLEKVGLKKARIRAIRQVNPDNL